MSDKPKVRLVGEDGNAFAIIGRCSKAIKQTHDGSIEDKVIKGKLAAEFQEEAMSGDYDHVLQTAMKYCEVE